MFRKLFLTAAAAAAVCVPLAGVASADPPADPGSNGNGVGAGGVPKKLGDAAAGLGVGNGDPIPPGSIFSNLAK